MIASARPGQNAGNCRLDDSTGGFEPFELEIVLGELDLLMASRIGRPLEPGLRELATMTESEPEPVASSSSGECPDRGRPLLSGRSFPSGTIVIEVDGRGVAYADELLARIERAGWPRARRCSWACCPPETWFDSTELPR